MAKVTDLDSVRAQISFRLWRGDKWDAILKWWRKRYPGTHFSIAENIRDEAEEDAERGRKYQNWPKDKPIDWL